MGTLKEYFENDIFALKAGVELLEIREGYAKARMLVTENHLNAGGVCQGGAIFTLADLAFAAAVNSHKQLTFSINSSINIFRSAGKGYIYAEAKEVFNHKRISNCEVRITDEENNLLATFNGTGYRKQFAIDVDELI
jgi:uncharacterized domain 1